jgi:hypothetical protein
MEGGMSEQEIDAKQIEKKVSDLSEAMERVRDDQASRDDVVVEMKQAGRARLELLAQDLQPVFKDIPDDNDQFEFAITNGEPSRLWIDMTSYVRMGREKRVYEFVKDTRMGRTILGKSEDRAKMSRIVTNYVAERILERERMIEGEWVALRDYDFSAPDADDTADSQKRTGVDNRLTAFGWLVAGLLLGAAAMVAWAWFGDIPAFLKPGA